VWESGSLERHERRTGDDTRLSAEARRAADGGAHLCDDARDFVSEAIVSEPQNADDTAGELARLPRARRTFENARQWKRQAERLDETTRGLSA
jgi:hypothetical protein